MRAFLWNKAQLRVGDGTPTYLLFQTKVGDWAPLSSSSSDKVVLSPILVGALIFDFSLETIKLFSYFWEMEFCDLFDWKGLFFEIDLKFKSAIEAPSILLSHTKVGDWKPTNLLFFWINWSYLLSSWGFYLRILFRNYLSYFSGMEFSDLRILFGSYLSYFIGMEFSNFFSVMRIFIEWGSDWSRSLKSPTNYFGMELL